jgi:CheY-like chemotaxis protein
MFAAVKVKGSLGACIAMISFPPQSPLAGRLVLLVEDEALGKSGIEPMLREAGAEVALAQDAYQATLVISGRALAAAVLDIALGEHTIRCICSQLDLHAVPCVFLGGSQDARGECCNRLPSSCTPVGAEALIGALTRLLMRTEGYLCAV